MIREKQRYTFYMGKFQWSAASIDWMLDAAKCSGYYAEIAKRIAARLPQNAHVLDAGCGLGDLTLALSPVVRHITAMDNEPRVISRLMERCHVGNVSAIMTDVFSYVPPKPFDALVLCFFGLPEEVLPLSNLTSGKVFVINTADDAKGFSLKRPSPSNKRTYCIRDIEQSLNQAGIPYEMETFQAENGQPFRTLEDAAAFFSFYENDTVDVEEIIPYLEKREDPIFPYYYPRLRSLGMITFENGRIPCNTSLRTS